MPVSRSTSKRGSVRAIWFGMRCAFTERAIAGTMENGAVDSAVVVLPRAPKPIGTHWPEPSFDRWLRERDVEIVEVDRLAGSDFDAVLGAAERHGVDIGVGACFPRKVPASLRESLACGALNIHPSLLPKLRGPEPVYHAYRQGLDETGVTIHVMDNEWDSGPILVQERSPLPEHGRSDDFEGMLAQLGGAMFGDIATAWCAGSIEPVAQDDAATTWAPVPGDEDRVIPDDLTVSRAARFLGACGPLIARDADTGELVPVADVIARDHGDFERLRAARRLVRMRCTDGELWLVRHTRQELVANSGLTI